MECTCWWEVETSRDHAPECPQHPENYEGMLAAQYAVRPDEDPA